MKQKISITIDESTLKEIDAIVDNIIIRNRSQAIETLVSQSLKEEKVAVILAGGSPKGLLIGKEYKFATMVAGKTLLEHAIEKLKEEGFTKIFIVGQKPILTRAFDILGDGTAFASSVEYVVEEDSRGTAESLRLLKGKVNKTFLVVYNDIIFSQMELDELLSDHKHFKGTATLMLTTTPNPERKGVAKLEGAKVLEFEQKPSESKIYVGFSSLFIAEPELLDQPGNSLEEDLFPRLASRGLLFGHVTSKQEIHMNMLQDVEEAEKVLKKG